MTTKEKAKELFEKMVENAYNSPFQEIDKTNYNAKQCALICVNEIIDDRINDLDDDDLGDSEDVYMLINYWKEVKIEIDKL